MSNNGWVGVDLDGTLAFYDGWKGIAHIGEPIPKMLERVKKWVARGITVKIFTARVAGKDADQVREHIWAWLEKHGLPRLEITNVKDFGMIVCWDDRAVQVVPNTGVTIDVFAMTVAQATVDKLREGVFGDD